MIDCGQLEPEWQKLSRRLGDAGVKIAYFDTGTGSPPPVVGQIKGTPTIKVRMKGGATRVHTHVFICTCSYARNILRTFHTHVVFIRTHCLTSHDLCVVSSVLYARVHTHPAISPRTTFVYDLRVQLY